MSQGRAVFETPMLDLCFWFWFFCCCCWYLPFWGGKVKISCDDLEQQVESSHFKTG